MKCYVNNFSKMIAKLVLAVLFFGQMMIFAPLTTLAAVDGSNVVISEIQAAGITLGSDEFIELYNPTASSISIAGWKIQYKQATGGSFSTKVTIAAGVLLDSHDHYLVVGSGYTGTVVADVTDSLGLSGTAGHVRILNSTDMEVDRVGYGQSTGTTADSPETSPINGIGNGGSVERRLGGINGNSTDSDNNSADFVIRNTSNPQNTLSTPTPTAPGAPTGLTGTCGDTKIELDWADVEGAKDYVVYIHDVAQVLFPLASATTITGLTNGTDYVIKVSARNQFNTEGMLSSPITVSPCAPIVVTPLALEATATYRMNGVSATRFGVGEVSVEISNVNTTALQVGETLHSVTLTRPNSLVVTIPLIADLLTGSWKTSYGFVVGAAGNTDDGIVSSQVTTNQNRVVSLLGGTNVFEVDTRVSQPLITATSRCSVKEDSFVATTDADVVSVWIYSHSNLDSQWLVAVAPVVNSKTTEIFIGDNVFSTLYIVAKDAVGNISATTILTNDLSAPKSPNLEVSALNGRLIATWDKVADASSYRIKWRQNRSNWHELVTSNITETVVINSGQDYEVAVTSMDGACNESLVSTAKGNVSIILASIPTVKAAERETAILAESIKVDSPKDGDGSTGKTASDKAKKDTTANQSETPIADVKDRSSLIVTIAIILIIAGIAIAVYSWYQGDESPQETKPHDGHSPKESTESKKPATSNRNKPKQSNRKTRW